MPPYEHSRQLAAEAAGLPLPPRLQAAVTTVLPLNQQQGLAAVPTCRAAPAARDSSSSTSSSTLTLDPWLLLEGGCTAGGSEVPALAAAAMASPAAAGPGLAVGGLPQPAALLLGAGAAAPPWLDGAVKRRRRDLCYMPAPASGSGGPLLTIDEQLSQRKHSPPDNDAAGAQAAAAAK